MLQSDVRIGMIFERKNGENVKYLLITRYDDNPALFYHKLSYDNVIWDSEEWLIHISQLEKQFYLIHIYTGQELFIPNTYNRLSKVD